MECVEHGALLTARTATLEGPWSRRDWLYIATGRVPLLVECVEHGALLTARGATLEGS